jgi:hypothetical protein
MNSASEFTKMKAPCGMELTTEVRATAAVDTLIAATEGAEKASPVADRRKHMSSAPLVQSGSADINPVPAIEARQKVSSASNSHLEKQVLEENIKELPEIACSGEEVRPLPRRSLAVKKIFKHVKIGWDGPDDQENPHNWSRSRKTTLMMLISIYRTTTTMAGSFLAPALQKIAVDLDIPTQKRTNIILSAYVLAFAVGLLLLAPTFEVFGRTRVLHCANVFFLLFNIAAGFSTTAGQMIAFRFLSGIGGSAPMAVSTSASFYPNQY